MLPNWSLPLSDWFEKETELKDLVLYPAFKAAVKLAIGKYLNMIKDQYILLIYLIDCFVTFEI